MFTLQLIRARAYHYNSRKTTCVHSLQRKARCWYVSVSILTSEAWALVYSQSQSNQFRFEVYYYYNYYYENHIHPSIFYILIIFRVGMELKPITAVTTTYKNKQLFTLTFTPTISLESPINLNPNPNPEPTNEHI